MTIIQIHIVCTHHEPANSGSWKPPFHTDNIRDRIMKNEMTDKSSSKINWQHRLVKTYDESSYFCCTDKYYYTIMITSDLARNDNVNILLFFP